MHQYRTKTYIADNDITQKNNRSSLNIIKNSYTNIDQNQDSMLRIPYQRDHSRNNLKQSIFRETQSYQNNRNSQHFSSIQEPDKSSVHNNYQRQTISSIYDASASKDDFIFTPKIMNYKKHQSKKRKNESSIDSYIQNVPLQMKTENKYKNAGALTSQRNFLTYQPYDNEFLGPFQEDRPKKVYNYIREDSAKTLKDNKIVNKNIKLYSNNYSPKGNQKIIISNMNSNVMTSIDTVRDNNDSYQQTHQDLFSQITKKLQNLSHIKDSFWQLLSSSQNLPSYSQRIPPSYIEKQQRIYDDMNSVQIELDYLIQLFSIHLRSMMLRDNKLMQRKKYYKSLYKKTRNQLIQCQITSQNNTQIDFIKSQQFDKQIKSQQDHTNQDKIKRLKGQIAELGDILNQRDREIVTLKNSLKMLEEDRIMEKIKQKRNSQSSLISGLNSIKDNKSMTEIIDQASNHKDELEESLSANPLFLDLLIECDRHIHENQNFVSQQDIENKQKQSTLDRELIYQIIDIIEQKYKSQYNNHQSDNGNNTQQQYQNFINQPINSQVNGQAQQFFVLQQSADQNEIQLYHSQSQGNNLSGYLNPNDSLPTQIQKSQKNETIESNTDCQQQYKQGIIDLRDSQSKVKSRNNMDLYLVTQAQSDQSINQFNQFCEMNKNSWKTNNPIVINNNLPSQSDFNCQDDNKTRKNVYSSQTDITSVDDHKEYHSQKQRPASKIEMKEQIFNEIFKKIKTTEMSLISDRDDKSTQRRGQINKKQFEDSEIQEKINRAEKNLHQSKLNNIKGPTSNIRLDTIQNQDFSYKVDAKRHYQNNLPNTILTERQPDISPVQKAEDSQQKQYFAEEDEDLLIQEIDKVEWPRGNPIDSSRINSKNSLLLSSNNKQNNNTNNSQNQSQDQQFNRFGFRLRQNSKGHSTESIEKRS
ncbi:UNKNOWN [Stylonychia lemnae]|uniref:Uncharacterized protein n=1 Tax=Stylonychia lemnae TaxID=5949 RepID=A0A078AQG8_STYLE|nr:UNKNOWN [Stylonychia lemnae]|eukprot:CDW84399.1 UNKNOWN [Stylonychia lemnae]